MAKQPVVGSVAFGPAAEANGRADVPVELDPKELDEAAKALRKLKRMQALADSAAGSKNCRLWGKTIGGAPIVLVNDKIKRAGQKALIEVATEAFLLGVKHAEEFKK